MVTSKTKRRYATKTVMVNMVPRKCDTLDTGSPMLGKDARCVWNVTLPASIEGKIVKRLQIFQAAVTKRSAQAYVVKVPNEGNESLIVQSFLYFHFHQESGETTSRGGLGESTLVHLNGLYHKWINKTCSLPYRDPKLVSSHNRVEEHANCPPNPSEQRCVQLLVPEFVEDTDE